MSEVEEYVKGSGVGSDKKKVSQRLVEMWKASTEAERSEYERKAAEDRDRYEREMSAYMPPGPVDAEGRRKRRFTPFKVFKKMQFTGVEAEIKSGGDDRSLVGKELTRRWRKMSVEQRRPFAELCQKWNGGGGGKRSEEEEEEDEQPEVVEKKRKRRPPRQRKVQKKI